MKAWWINTALPWLTSTLFPAGRSLLARWCDSLRASPASHAVSMCFAVVLWYVLLFAIRWL